MSSFLSLTLTLTSPLLQPNVLIDDKRRALLADFGFARVCNPPGFVGASKSSDSGGTRPYMAPELFMPANDNQSTISAPKMRVDVFAFGTLIYEVLRQISYANIKYSIHQ